MATEPAERPKPKMTWWKALILSGAAIIFDTLKFLFDIILIAAPFIAGVLAKLYLESWGVPSWLANIAGVVAGAGGYALETLFWPIAMLIGAFGVIMGIIMGVVGWLTVAILFLVFRVNIFSPKLLLKSLVGVGVSVIPFLNMLPALTLTTLRIIKGVKKDDRAALAAWEAQNKAQLEAAAAQKRAAQYEALNTRTQQEVAAARQAQAEEEEAFALEQERLARMDAEAANDNEVEPQKLLAA